MNKSKTKNLSWSEAKSYSAQAILHKQYITTEETIKALWKVIHIIPDDDLH